MNLNLFNFFNKTSENHGISHYTMIDRHTEREKEEEERKRGEKKERVYRLGESIPPLRRGILKRNAEYLEDYFVAAIGIQYTQKKKKREGESMQYTPKIEHSVYEFFSACGPGLTTLRQDTPPVYSSYH